MTELHHPCSLKKAELSSSRQKDMGVYCCQPPSGSYIAPRERDRELYKVVKSECVLVNDKDR